MKRLFLILLIPLFAVMNAGAQPKSLGLRMGYDCQVSYQHTVNATADFLEVDMGMEVLGKGINAACAYNFTISSPEFTEKSGWSLYAGPAVKAGYMWIGGYIAVGAQLGLEYEFDFPLQFSVDIRPAVGMAMEGRYAFIFGAEALFGSIPCLSLRYRF